MALDPLRFEDFELDLGSYQVRRSGRILRLERIPTEVLFLLAERRGQLVTREEIIEKLWGKNAFLDTDNAINTAIRKIRRVLKDDPAQPRFVQTVTGKGYRFIGRLAEEDAASAQEPATAEVQDLRAPEENQSNLHKPQAALENAGAFLPAPSPCSHYSPPATSTSLMYPANML